MTAHERPHLARALLDVGDQLQAERERRERAEAEVREWEKHHCEKRITTRCPACGHQTLFIAVGGHLTCSWLKCPEPGVERAITEGRCHPALQAAALSPAPAEDAGKSDECSCANGAVCIRCPVHNPSGTWED